MPYDNVYRWWAGVGCIVIAFVVIPVIVYQMRHQPKRLSEGTQHIVVAGLVARMIFIGLTWVFWFLR